MKKIVLMINAIFISLSAFASTQLTNVAPDYTFFIDSSTEKVLLINTESKEIIDIIDISGKRKNGLIKLITSANEVLVYAKDNKLNVDLSTTEFSQDKSVDSMYSIEDYYEKGLDEYLAGNDVVSSLELGLSVDEEPNDEYFQKANIARFKQLIKRDQQSIENAKLMQEKREQRLEEILDDEKKGIKKSYSGMSASYTKAILRRDIDHYKSVIESRSKILAHYEKRLKGIQTDINVAVQMLNFAGPAQFAQDIEDATQRLILKDFGSMNDQNVLRVTDVVRLKLRTDNAEIDNDRNAVSEESLALTDMVSRVSKKQKEVKARKE